MLKVNPQEHGLIFEWQKELAAKKALLDKYDEGIITARRGLKVKERELREAKRVFNKAIIERAHLKRDIRHFWERKRARLYAIRHWIKTHPGEAFEKISH